MSASLYTDMPLGTFPKLTYSDGLADGKHLSFIFIERDRVRRELEEGQSAVRIALRDGVGLVVPSTPRFTVTFEDRIEVAAVSWFEQVSDKDRMSARKYAKKALHTKALDKCLPMH